MGLPLRWPAEAIWEAVAPQLPGFTVEMLPEIASTNTELMRRCRSGQREPVLLVAERQTAGRGRLGRQWHTPAGSALTFSLGLPLAPADWSGLSLAVGTSLAESLGQAAAADIRIKWPNDLWLGSAKLAGILIETAGAGEAASMAAHSTATHSTAALAKGVHCAAVHSTTPPNAAHAMSRYVIVGVGINVRPPAPGWTPPPSEGQVMAAQPPAWLQDMAPTLDAPATLQAVAAPLVVDLLRFQTQGFAAFTQRFAQRDLLTGREVLLSDGRTGRALGVSATGALRLETAQGVQDVISGDVSVRPV